MVKEKYGEATLEVESNVRQGRHQKYCIWIHSSTSLDLSQYSQGQQSELVDLLCGLLPPNPSMMTDKACVVHTREAAGCSRIVAVVIFVRLRFT